MCTPALFEQEAKHGTHVHAPAVEVDDAHVWLVRCAGTGCCASVMLLIQCENKISSKRDGHLGVRRCAYRDASAKEGRTQFSLATKQMSTVKTLSCKLTCNLSNGASCPGSGLVCRTRFLVSVTAHEAANYTA